MSSNSSIPITPLGYEKIKEELRRLRNIERPNIIQEIADARALGDLTENAEYHSAKEKQSFIEGRIQELESKLSRLHVVSHGNRGAIDRVVFGSSVELLDVSENSKKEKKRYTIVGELETDVKNSVISIDSPMAKSLINKSIGDIVQVDIPRGIKEYEITAIYIN